MTKDEIRNILEAPITNPDFIDKFVLAGEKLVNFFESTNTSYESNASATVGAKSE